ncbi:hypothetical protein J6590_008332 [Homalodisca vitripennis]|nr:hypothetical protein J6590_008332 [Homalodisca vitripennis]
MAVSLIQRLELFLQSRRLSQHCSRDVLWNIRVLNLWCEGRAMFPPLTRSEPDRTYTMWERPQSGQAVVWLGTLFSAYPLGNSTKTAHNFDK